MNALVTPILRDFNPPYVGRGLIILWFILDHDFDCILNIRTGILNVYRSSIPWGDGIVGFCIERNIDANDNAKITWVFHNFSNPWNIDLKKYGYEAPDLPYHRKDIFTSYKYWIRQTRFYPTNNILSGYINKNSYGNRLPSFQHILKYGKRINGWGNSNYDMGISYVDQNANLRIRAAHHGCDMTCWGGFGIVINFNLALYNKIKDLPYVPT